MRWVDHRRKVIKVGRGIFKRLPDVQVVRVRRCHAEKVCREHRAAPRKFRMEIGKKIAHDFRFPKVRVGDYPRFAKGEKNIFHRAIGREAYVVKIELVKTRRVGLFCNADCVVPCFKRPGVYVVETFIVRPKRFVAFFLHREVGALFRKKGILKNGDARNRINIFFVKRREKLFDIGNPHIGNANLFEVRVFRGKGNAPRIILRINDDGVEFGVFHETGEFRAPLRGAGNPACHVNGLDRIGCSYVGHLYGWDDAFFFFSDKRDNGKKSLCLICCGKERDSGAEKHAKDNEGARFFERDAAGKIPQIILRFLQYQEK